MWRNIPKIGGRGGGHNGSASMLKKREKRKETEEEIHCRRVSQILRYISTMQQSNHFSSVSCHSFVRALEEEALSPEQYCHEPFFKNLPSPQQQQVGDEEDVGGRVLFTTYDFQQLAPMLLDTKKPVASSMPFSFYTAQNGSADRNNNTGWKRPAAQRGRTANSSSGCWMRLTRFAAAEPPSATDANIQLYLQNWSRKQKRPTKRLLTLDNLQRGAVPATSNTVVKKFLKNYLAYLKAKHLRRQLEPIYNGLFEWYQQSSERADQMDLIWGLGQATYRNKSNNTLVDGPLLEVRVEVELARDGALLVRPKHHVGVTLNRAVVGPLNGSGNNAAGAISSGTSGGGTATATVVKDDGIRTINQIVEQLDTTDISPGEPATYTSLLKRIAVELCPGGTFSSSKTFLSKRKRLEAAGTGNNLVVTDAWCVYASPRPSAVWARDALAFAEKTQLTTSKPGNVQPQHLPRALWALTHGPNALEEVTKPQESLKPSASLVSYLFNKKEHSEPKQLVETAKATTCRPHFPLPTSNAQDQIAELLLSKHYPAVVCEGPPGTGKTHTIANIVCAYLCQGKRVLVTSKGSPALSVLRDRLPDCVQEMCVDVSMGESAGMRQLQQTVEQLANKVSWVNTERETSRSQEMQENIENLKNELEAMDQRLEQNAEYKRKMTKTVKGERFFQLAPSLIRDYPWLMKSIAKWEVQQLVDVQNQIGKLFMEPNDPINWVSGYPTPVPSDELIALAASKAGHVLARLKIATKQAIVSVPLVGGKTLQQQRQQSAKEQLKCIRIKGAPPRSKSDWNIVFQALEREKEINYFRQAVLEPLTTREEWPVDAILETRVDGKVRVKSSIIQIMANVKEVKSMLSVDLHIEDHIQKAVEMRELETRRASLASRIQNLAEDLVACRVVAELSRNFSADAQSALVKFAQVSGKAKFGKSSQPSKMTQRQRRKRQEYLDAFEKCVRYIPCWILTSSQISDYLPAECLFDLVVIDEASQSDITVLPGMLRGRQWLIVGDGKQVSPTESFVSEEQIELLKAAAPESPFEASMLPGHSFFDLCAEAFPRGRVILREHFRCAPEIITYSNAEFYNGNLIPLRLPMSTERMSPSLIDVLVPNGRKTGKVNEQECDEIVRMIKTYVDSCTLLRKRSIGVISFVGDEQSRLIRGRLLDSIGPHKFKLHDILVGEPPSFQGAERDIVYLSLVSSPGHVVTQTQSMHAQRANVALSRARDQMVLVRSIGTNHIPNSHDIQFSILDFFEQATARADNVSSLDERNSLGSTKSAIAPFQANIHQLLKELLHQRSFTTRSMGVVWENAICVEDHTDGNSRVAMCVEACGESNQDWTDTVQQQRSIERVGWKCLRVDALSFLASHDQIMEKVELYLSEAGVFPSTPPISVSASGGQLEVEEEEASIINGELAPDNVEDEPLIDIVSVSDEDSMGNEGMECSNDDSKDDGTMNLEYESLGNGETASDYGNIANLDFLRGSNSSFGSRPVARTIHRNESAENGDANENSAKHDEDNLLLGYDKSVASENAKSISNGTELDENETEQANVRPRVDKSSRVLRRTQSNLARASQLEDDGLEIKQRAISESRFAHEDVSGSSSSDEEHGAVASISASRASKRSSKRRRLDKYSRDARYYHTRSEQQEDLSYDEYIREVQPEASINDDFSSKENDDSEYIDEGASHHD